MTILYYPHSREYKYYIGCSGSRESGEKRRRLAFHDVGQCYIARDWCRHDMSVECLVRKEAASARRCHSRHPFHILAVSPLRPPLVVATLPVRSVRPAGAQS